MTYEEKLALYRAGHYVFKAPPVCTAYWDTDSWIKFIDACNGWRKPWLEKTMKTTLEGSQEFVGYHQYYVGC